MTNGTPEVPLTGRAHVQALVSSLHPAPSQVRVGGRRTSGDVEYLVLPSADRPRLIVPQRPRRVRAAAVRRFSSAADAGTRTILGAIAASTWIGGARLLPDRVGVVNPTGEDPSIHAWLSEQLGQSVHCALYVGPRRAVQKPVALVMDDRGRLIAFLKMGTSPVSVPLVRNEGDALTRLGGAALAVVRSPRVLHRADWNGHPVLVQEALATRGPVADTDAVVARASAEVAASGDLGRSPVDRSGYLERTRARVDRLPDPWRGRLVAALSSVSEAGLELGFGGWHGDWSPWNMAIGEDGRLGVWDWEHYAPSVPVGFDAAHHRLATALAADRTVSASTAARQMSELAPAAVSQACADLGLPGDQEHARAVILLYLVEIGCRYLEDGEQDAGTRGGDLDAWLAEALTREAALVEQGRATR